MSKMYEISENVLKEFAKCKKEIYAQLCKIEVNMQQKFNTFITGFDLSNLGVDEIIIE